MLWEGKWYFTEMFTSCGMNGFEKAINDVPLVISYATNQDLTQWTRSERLYFTWERMTSHQFHTDFQDRSINGTGIP